MYKSKLTTVSENENCSDQDIAIKSFFLGPASENADFFLKCIQSIAEDYIEWRRAETQLDGTAISSSDIANPLFIKKRQATWDEIQKIMLEFQKEIPKFSPRYIGHMFSDLSLPGLLGYFLANLHNPNNVSQESSRVGTKIEKLAIASLAKMLGYGPHSIGHFTSCGSIANFESLTRAKARWLNNLAHNLDSGLPWIQACSSLPKKPQGGFSIQDLSLLEINQLAQQKFNVDTISPKFILPISAHYSWKKGIKALGFGVNNIIAVDLNKFGEMDSQQLKRKIDLCLKQNHNILSVISVCGTTELGVIDPIHETQQVLAKLKQDYNLSIWHHIDAAYGGYFASARELFECASPGLEREKLFALSSSDSATIDPHKLGYLPYPAGAFICANKIDYTLTQSSAAYVDFQKNIDLGLYTFEGSRSAAPAVGCYLSNHCIGLDSQGYGRLVKRCIDTSEKLKEKISKLNNVHVLKVNGTNIMCFSISGKKLLLSECNMLTEKAFKFIHIKNQSESRSEAFYVSKTKLGSEHRALISEFCEKNNLQQDTDQLSLIRTTIMNPYFSSKNFKQSLMGEFANFIIKLAEDLNAC